MLVVHENFNAGWEASLAGHRLTPLQVDGWQQAFLVPPAHRHRDAHLRPERSFAIGLWLGLLVAALLIGVALLSYWRPAARSHRSNGGGPGWPADRTVPPGPRLRSRRSGRRLDRRALAVLLPVALGLLAGWAGLALGAAATIGWLCLPAVRAARRWLPRPPPAGSPAAACSMLSGRRCPAIR